MRVFLIHGMGRTSISFLLLAQRLRAAGYQISSFNYLVTAHDLQAIAESFAERVASELTQPDEPYAIVGHSLGGILTRAADSLLPSGLRAVVMLGTPNRSPKAAHFAAGKAPPVWRLLTRDTGDCLRDQEFFDRLPFPKAPTLSIAGDGGPQRQWMPLGAEPNDGVVTVAESRLEGAEHSVVPAVHTFLMNQRDVFEQIDLFLEKHEL